MKAMGLDGVGGVWNGLWLKSLLRANPLAALHAQHLGAKRRHNLVRP
jgi:hypothetical protein